MGAEDIFGQDGRNGWHSVLNGWYPSLVSRGCHSNRRPLYYFSQISFGRTARCPRQNRASAGVERVRGERGEVKVKSHR